LGNNNVFWWNICGNEVQIKFDVEKDKEQSLQNTFHGSYNGNIYIYLKTNHSLLCSGTRQYIYYTLLEVLIHELQHYYQDLLLRKKRGYCLVADYDWQYHKVVFPVKRFLHDLCDETSMVLQYFLMPPEIDAYVTTCYFLSKLQNISFKKVLHEELVGTMSFLLTGFSTKDARRIWGIIKREFENYAVLKFGETT
jgi:hypothetical protein